MKADHWVESSTDSCCGTACVENMCWATACVGDRFSCCATVCTDDKNDDAVPQPMSITGFILCHSIS